MPSTTRNSARHFARCSVVDGRLPEDQQCIRRALYFRSTLREVCRAAAYETDFGSGHPGARSQYGKTTTIAVNRGDRLSIAFFKSELPVVQRLSGNGSMLRHRAAVHDSQKRVRRALFQHSHVFTFRSITCHARSSRGECVR